MSDTNTTPLPAEDANQKLSFRSVWRLLSLAKPYKWRFVLGGLMTIVASGINLSLPVVGQRLMPQVLEERSITALNTVAISLGGLLVIGMTISFFQWSMVARTGNAVVADLRAKLFAHIQRLPVAYFDRTKSGEITSRLSNDVTTVQQVITLDIVNFFSNIIQFLGGFVIAMVIDWKLTSVILGFFGTLLIGFIIAGRQVRGLGRRTSDALSATMGIINEGLSSVRIVKAFARHDHEDKRVSRQLKRLQLLSDRTTTWEAAIGSSAIGLMLLLLIFVVWFGGRRVIEGDMKAETFFAYLLTLLIITGPMSLLATLYSRLQRAVGAADRLFEILDEPEEANDNPDAVPFPNGVSQVTFSNVIFGYSPERPVLKGLNLVLPPGKVTALVGQSGAGKTTLSALLYRFYDPQSGTIEIDGVSIEQMQRKSLREHIGIVPQMPILFNVSVRDNIRYGRLDATDEEVEAAARAANVAEFVDRLPERYSTIVGERGVTLSGGQNQRIAIARALIKNPRILILDEATSALDTRSEALVREALERLMQGRTTLVIAHRLSTIQNADQIVVMNNGQVVEIGTHQELLQNNGHYAALHNLGAEAELTH